MQRKRRGMRASEASARGALGRWVVEVGSRKGEYLTAKIRNQKKRTKRGRAAGATLMHSPRRIQNSKGFSTLRVAQKVRFDP